MLLKIGEVNIAPTSRHYPVQLVEIEKFEGLLVEQSEYPFSEGFALPEYLYVNQVVRVVCNIVHLVMDSHENVGAAFPQRSNFSAALVTDDLEGKLPVFDVAFVVF